MLHATRLNRVIYATSVHSIYIDFAVSIFHLRQLVSKRIFEEFLQKFILPRNSNIVVIIFINLLLSMYICTTRFNNYQLYVQFSGWVYSFYQIGGENRGRNDLSYHSMARIKEIVKSNTSTWFFKSLSFACKFTAMIIICKMQITRWFFSHPQRINLNSVLSKVRQRHQSCACIVCTYVCKTAWGRHASE